MVGEENLSKEDKEIEEVHMVILVLPAPSRDIRATSDGAARDESMLVLGGCMLRHWLNKVVSR